MLPLLAALTFVQNTAAPAQAAGVVPVPPPTGYTRMITRRDGTLEMQTAAQRLVADGKPTVWLVGAIHVGQKPYYAALQRLLGYQDAVFYEGVRADASAPTVAQRPKPAPGSASGDAKGPASVYTTFSNALGLDFQLADIDYTSPKWSNVDLTMADLDRLNAAESGGKPSQFDQVKNLLTPGSPMATQLATVMGMATPGMKEAIKLLMVRVAGAGNTPGMDPATERIILKARNKAVTDALATSFASATPPRSIGVFYGAKHMDDLQSTLVKDYGYRLDEKRWFAAADADPKKVDAMGQTMLQSFDKMLAPKATPAKAP